MNDILLRNGMTISNICLGTDIMPELFFSSNRTKEFIDRRVYQSKRFLKGEYHIYKKYNGIIKVVNKAISSGCKFFDTSRAYGSSEVMLSRALGGCRVINIKYVRS